MGKSKVSQKDSSDILFTIRKSTLVTASIAVLTFILGGVGGYVLAWYTLGSIVPVGVVDVPQAPQATPLPSRVDDVSIDDDPSIGPPDAPIVIVEFSDFM